MRGNCFSKTFLNNYNHTLGMKKIKLFCGIFIGLIIFASCSSNDDDDNVKKTSNGFTINGTFYETNSAKSSNGNPYYLIFDNNNKEYYGYFILKSGEQIDGVPLLKGTYSTNNGPDNIFGIDGYHPIAFNGDSNEGDFVYTDYWNQDNNFKSGTVTINSINSDANNQVTQIDVDYTFKWIGVTVKGNYSGQVIPN